MEFKKKTIIWEDNNEPPKDYIWAKKDGKFYEYSYATRSWIESKSIKAEASGDSDSETGEIDYEAIYQFQIKKLKDRIPAPILSDTIIPEHYSDVTDCVGTEYSEGTYGVFKASQDYYENARPVVLPHIIGGVLFMDWTNGDIIFLGEYSYSEDSGDSGTVN